MGTEPVGSFPACAAGVESFVGRRSENQDRCGAWLGNGWALLAVADGMGGARGGAVASQNAIDEVDQLRAWLASRKGGVPSPEMRARLATLFVDANCRIYDIARGDPGLQGMGTTLVVAVVLGRRLFIAHAGDSRAYRLSADDAVPLTKDHNVAEDRPDLAGGEDLIYARSLTRCVGDTPSVEPEIYPPARPSVGKDGQEQTSIGAGEAAVEDCLLSDGQAIVLCSDGASGKLSDGDLKALLLKAENPKAAARLIIREAFERGSTDNISVAVLEVGKIARSGNLVGSVDLPALASPAPAVPKRRPRADRILWGLCAFLAAVFVAIVLVGIRVLDQERREGPVKNDADNPGESKKIECPFYAPATTPAGNSSGGASWVPPGVEAEGRYDEALKGADLKRVAHYAGELLQKARHKAEEAKSAALERDDLAAKLYDEAEKLLSEAIQVASGKESKYAAYLSDADKLMTEEKWSEAIEAYTKAGSVDKTKEVTEGMTRANRSLEEEKRRDEEYRQRLDAARAALKKGNYDEAEKEVGSALELIPNGEEAVKLRDQLTPTLAVKAELDGKEYRGARIFVDGQVRQEVTPTTLALEKGKTYMIDVAVPPSAGKTYALDTRKVEVKQCGPQKEFRAVIKEIIKENEVIPPSAPKSGTDEKPDRTTGVPSTRGVRGDWVSGAG